MEAMARALVGLLYIEGIEVAHEDADHAAHLSLMPHQIVLQRLAGPALGEAEMADLRGGKRARGHDRLRQRARSRLVTALSAMRIRPVRKPPAATRPAPRSTSPVG